MTGIDWKADFLSGLLTCPFAIGRSFKFALGNYSFSSAYLLRGNRIGRHVAVYYVAVSCGRFEFVPRFCQYILFVFSVPLLAFLLFSFPPIFSLDATDVCEYSNKSVDEHSLLKIANDDASI